MNKKDFQHHWNFTDEFMDELTAILNTFGGNITKIETTEKRWLY